MSQTRATVRSRCTLVVFLLLLLFPPPVAAGTDSDGDGVPDGSDCAPFVNSYSAAPGPLADSLRAGPASTRFYWAPVGQANVYDVYRGVRSGGLWSYDHTCLESESPDEQTDDIAVPAAGELFWYLVEPVNSCGRGGIGVDSSATPRPHVADCVPVGGDADGDGVPDVDDNCPLTINPGQEDADLDSRGDLCDNCVADANENQGDLDQDGIGDVCDSCTDGDGDGLGDPGFPASLCLPDNCPTVFNPLAADGDLDGLGDACDACPADSDNDIDGDGICGNVDLCPEAGDPFQQDNDRDGQGDACDDDDDGDGVLDAADNCPFVANAAQQDTDGDAVGDACDPCYANPDTSCLRCPDAANTDADGDGACHVERNLVASYGPMRFQANSSDPGNGSSWYLPGFDDSAWTPGTYGVGFDDSAQAVFLIETVVPAGTRSVFTRAAVEADPFELLKIFAAADYDDAWAMWINGTEVIRSPNLPAGPLDWNTALLFNHESSNGVLPDWSDRTDVTAAALPLFVAGTNEIAVAVWNFSAVSSDLVLAPRLSALVAIDNCLDVANPDQADGDGDGLGDVCDPCFGPSEDDTDGDGVCDDVDVCPFDPDDDADADGVCGDVDNCPDDFNPGQEDADMNGVGDACDVLSAGVFLNEVDYDQLGQEFVELYAAAGPVDITGWRLTDQETGLNSLDFVFAAGDDRFACREPFVMEAGDIVVVWQGSGVSDCDNSDGLREIYLGVPVFLAGSGDDLLLQDAALACRDYVAFENGANVNPPPVDCGWTGPNPSNGGATGTSLSRIDNPFTDTDSGSDWEASGSSVTVGPGSPGMPNVAVIDTDGDGILDIFDNCPLDPNPGQEDCDGDSVGDACDVDTDGDGDGVCDGVDNCPAIANPGQEDCDGDLIGDACDTQTDGDADGVCDDVDNCPADPNPGQEDCNGNLIGDACDLETDGDGDGLCDGVDPCPLDPANDADADGICGDVDNCPTISNPGQEDADMDGIGDVCESLPAGVYLNEVDYHQLGQEFIELYAAEGPVDMTGWRLTDQETGSTSLDFVFADSDSRYPCGEPFVLEAGDIVVVWQGAGTSDCDNADGVREIFLDSGVFLSANGDDLLLQNAALECRDYVAFETGPSVNAPPADCVWTGPNPSNGDVAGTSISRFDGVLFDDTDSGSDWEASGATVTAGPGSPGSLNVSGPDTDGDGIPDLIDNCPLTANPGQADCDGDGSGDACDSEIDDDGDGVCNGVDNCPATANPGQEDCDGDSIGDVCDAQTDTDGDGLCDDVDNCPGDPNPAQEDCDGDFIGDACDVEIDTDGDGLCDDVDPCPLDPDNDADADGVCGDVDNCPDDFNPGQEDADMDGQGDACETLPEGVYLNEVNYDQLTQEFVELYAAQGPVELTGWRLTDQDTAGSALDFVFADSDARFPCGEPFLMEAGDIVVVWQGAGTSDCDNGDGVRHIFLGSAAFLAGSGDDVVLQDQNLACRDYVAFENGVAVNPPPVDCLWSGPNPSNGEVAGTSISRFDAAPFTDTDSGADWEASGSTTTAGPASPGQPNEP